MMRATIAGQSDVVVADGRQVVGMLEVGAAKGDRAKLRINGGELVVRRDFVRVGELSGSEAVLEMDRGALHCVSVIYVGGYHTESALIIRQAKEQGMKATLMGGDALVTKEFFQVAGPAGEGTLMTFSPDPRRNAVAAKVVKAFTDKKIDPEGYVLYTYATIQIWAEAVKKANTTDPKKVAAALKASGPWPRVLGMVNFNKKGDVTAGAYVMYNWDAKGNYNQM